MHKLPIVTYFFLFALSNVFSISPASAAETLFYIVKRTDWLTYSATSTYRPASFSKDDFIPLLTIEQVIPTVHTLFQGETDLLLLKLNVSTTDPLFKWETAPGSEVSSPHYYGDLSPKLIKKIYPFRPRKDGSFVLPPDPFGKRLMTRMIPKSLSSRFLSYHGWQKTDRFHQLQVDNFRLPKVQLQWWYFDFFLHDGSSVVMAFIPQHWWEETSSAQEKKSVFTMSLKTKQGNVKRFTTVVRQSEIKTSADHLEIPARFVIRSVGSGDDRTYSVQINFPEVTGVFTITPTQPPFAAFPTGVMPAILRPVLSTAPVGSPRFSYVSQIPNSTVSGTLAWGEYQTEFSGQGYHEQGRLNDTPARQGGNWTWYHFAGEGWNIFGSPGSYIYLQKGDQILRSGVHLIAKEYTLTNRTFASPDHAKLLTGGEISFRHENLAFRLTLPPASAKTLICFPSANPNQVWGTAEGTATLSISEGSTTTVVTGQMFLETCSWEAGDAPEGKRNTGPLQVSLPNFP